MSLVPPPPHPPFLEALYFFIPGGWEGRGTQLINSVSFSLQFSNGWERELSVQPERGAFPPSELFLTSTSTPSEIRFLVLVAYGPGA